MDTVTNPISEAQAPGVFDVLSFVEQTAYPEQKVVLFQNVKAAADYTAAQEERFEFDKAGVETPPELDERLVGLSKAISDSALVFELRGLPPKFVQDIWEEVAPEGDEATVKAWERKRDNNLIAKTIQRVTNAKGDVDPGVWDGDKVEALRGFMKEGEIGKLVKAVSEVNFNAMIFDQATDAGFSGRGSNLAE